MKKVFHAIVVLVLTCSLLPSCKMRPEDAVRLKAEAEAGNLKSMEMLAANADTLISASERNHYMDVLTENGNFRALSGRFSEEFVKSGKLSEKQWQAMYMRWMEKGAKMGTPDCMYRLGVMYQEKEHLDTAKAMYWFRQAADSLQASARVELRKAAGELTALDAPRFAFRQMWDYNAREQSFLNRFSNATFHFMSECLRSCWKNLFSARWWQSLLLMLMMLGVLIAGIIFALSRRGREGLSVAACGIYGWIKEETGGEDANARMLAETSAPEIKTVFSAWGSYGWLDQYRRFGTRGVVSERAGYADALMYIWNALERGDAAKADAAFAQYLLMMNLKETIPGGHLRGFNLYVLKKRGIFKNHVSREYADKEHTPGKWKLEERTFTPGEIAEIEDRYARLMPYLDKKVETGK